MTLRYKRTQKGEGDDGDKRRIRGKEDTSSETTLCKEKTERETYYNRYRSEIWE